MSVREILPCVLRGAKPGEATQSKSKDACAPSRVNVMGRELPVPQVVQCLEILLAKTPRFNLYPEYNSGDAANCSRCQESRDCCCFLQLKPLPDSLMITIPGPS